MQYKCFTCGKEIERKCDDKTKPFCCSRACQTEEYFKEFSEWLLKKRGYPFGYKSLDAYENALIKERVCVKCGKSFFGNALQQLCRGCVEIERVEKIKKPKRKNMVIVGTTIGKKQKIHV